MASVLTRPPQRAKTRFSPGQGRNEQRDEAYFVSYVESLRDARTQLPDFFSILLEDGLRKFHDTALHVVIVGDRPGNRHLTGLFDGNAFANQGAGIDKEPGAHALFKTVILEIAHFPSELYEAAGKLAGDACFMLYNCRFNVRGRIVELDGHKPLLGAGFQVFEHTLITRIVGDHQQKVIGGLDDLPLLFDRQKTTVVAERMDNDSRVLACFDYLVEIHDRAVLHTQCQRAIDPDRILPLEEIATDEIRCCEVFVTSDRDKRPSQPVSHVLYKTRLSAPGRPFQHDRHPAFRGGREQADFTPNFGVVGLLLNAVLPDVELAPRLSHLIDLLSIEP